jgi:hypothetical protein
MEIVRRGSDGFIVLNGDTFATSTIPYGSSSYTSSLSIGDGDGDGTRELVTEAGGNVVGISPADGTVRWSIPASWQNSITNAAVANVDTDAAPEVIWTAYSGTGQALVVGDPASQGIVYLSSSRSDFSFASRDLDGDGRAEYVVADQIFDAATGASRGFLSTAGLPQGGTAGVIYGIGQLDGDPALEIVGSSAGYIVTWDGVTKQVEFKGNTSMNPTDVVVANIDGDPVDEILVGSFYSGLVVLDGATNIIQKSISFPGGGINAMALADLNGDAKAELVVAATDHVTVYDTATWGVLGTQEWYGVTDVAATSAEGGLVAAVSRYGFGLRLFHGAALTGGWPCEGSYMGKVAFAAVVDAQYAVVSDTNYALTGLMRFYPAGAATCPEPLRRTIDREVLNVNAFDATGDGRDDLVVITSSAAEVLLVGLGTETRGDVDGDGIITAGDIDAATDYVFGAAPGSSPSADTNADERISPEDLLVLINYEFAGGTEPQP